MDESDCLDGQWIVEPGILSYLRRQWRYFPNVVEFNAYQHKNPILTIFVFWHMNNHNDLLNPDSWNTKERPSSEVIVISNNLVALVSYESPGWSNYPLEPWFAHTCRCGNCSETFTCALLNFLTTTLFLTTSTTANAVDQMVVEYRLWLENKTRNKRLFWGFWWHNWWEWGWDSLKIYFGKMEVENILEISCSL